MKLTENFTLEEFLKSATAKAAGIENTPSEAALANLKRLANYLQRVRNCYMHPITISSGYRNKAVNALVPNSAKNSQHVSGEAADLITGSKVENRRLFELIRKMGGFDQLIDEADLSWIHVSYRAGRCRGEVLKMVKGKYYKV